MVDILARIGAKRDPVSPNIFLERLFKPSVVWQGGDSNDSPVPNTNIDGGRHPFIESSTVPSTKGLMAPSIVDSDDVQGETFLPRQIFVFGGFVLRANSLGHLEKIDSYAPGHQVRFGNLNYIADIRGDLIFDGFEPMSGAPHNHDEHDLVLPSDCVREITPATTPALNPEQIAPSVDGWMDPPGRPHNQRR